MVWFTLNMGTSCKVIPKTKFLEAERSSPVTADLFYTYFYKKWKTNYSNKIVVQHWAKNMCPYNYFRLLNAVAQFPSIGSSTIMFFVLFVRAGMQSLHYTNCNRYTSHAIDTPHVPWEKSQKTILLPALKNKYFPKIFMQCGLYDFCKYFTNISDFLDWVQTYAPFLQKNLLWNSA